MARTHIVAGGISWIAFAGIAHIPMNPFHVALAMGSSLLPDMDHPKSVFGRMIYPVSGIISGIFGHRGITHSIFAVAVIIVSMFYFGATSGYIVSAISVGYLSHILADWMTPIHATLFKPTDCPYRKLWGSRCDVFHAGRIAVLLQ